MQILVLIQNIQAYFTVSVGIIMVSSPMISVVHCPLFFCSMLECIELLHYALE